MTAINHPLFLENLSETAIKSYSNEDIVIKTALQVFEQQYELSTKNVRGAYETFDFNAEQAEKLNKMLDDTYDVVSSLKEDEDKMARKAYKKIRGKTNLVCAIYAMSENDVTLAKTVMKEFFGDSDKYEADIETYNNACTNGTNHSANVIARNDALRSAFDESIF